jgi:hypothetical protein
MGLARKVEGHGTSTSRGSTNRRIYRSVAVFDDEQSCQILRLFNEYAGRQRLLRQGYTRLQWLSAGMAGISCFCNHLVAAIKTAKYYEMDERDVIFTPLTDSMELYASRRQEMEEQHGRYDDLTAGAHYARYLAGTGIDYMRELTWADRKALHNFKYFTWIEQQGRTSDELRALWDDDFWKELFAAEQVAEWDQLITQFNAATGLLKAL